MNLIAGPWIGEFGWELCAWQGVIRQMAPQYDKVIIHGRPGHQYLYEDFMDEYVEFAPQGKEPNMWMNDGTEIRDLKSDSPSWWVPPQQFSLMPNAPEQKFLSCGQKGKHGGRNVICHSRKLDKYGSDYVNTQPDVWADIMSGLKGCSVVSVGTKSGAEHIPDTEDCRGMPLEDLCDMIANSEVMIGPSSGPMHLGSLCKTPLVVWSGYEKSRSRYESEWNPFKSPVKVIDAGDADPWGAKGDWQPDPEEIVRATNLFMEAKDERDK